MTTHTLTPSEQQAVLDELRNYNSSLSAIQASHPFLESYHFEIYDQVNQVITVLKNNHTLRTRTEEFLEELEDKKANVIKRLKDNKSSCYVAAMKSSRSYNLDEERALLKAFMGYSEALGAIRVNSVYLQRYNECVHSQIKSIFAVLDYHNTIGIRADEALKEVELNKLDLIAFFSDTSGYVFERSLEKQLNQIPRDNEPLFAVARAHKAPNPDVTFASLNSRLEDVDELFEEWESSFKF
ncbi:hypothetical protein ACEQ7L_003658 [Vibrio fluvialis]